MRDIGMAGARGRAKGKRADRTSRRQPAIPQHDGRTRLVRGMTIYVAFAVICIATAYVTARSVLHERERIQTETQLRNAEFKRQGRLVHAQTDGHCRMTRFDNVSGRPIGSPDVLACDTPMRDTARDFNWGNR
jgi:hypothetical protein